MSLFENIKLSELYSFVHDSGRWQDEKCYKTVIGRVHSTFVIANMYTYGTNDEQERTHDAIVVDVLNGKGKIGTMWKGEEVELNARVRSLIRRLENARAFDDYVIEIDMKEESVEKKLKNC